MRARARARLRRSCRKPRRYRNALRAAGRFAEARAAFERAFAISERALGSENANVADSLQGLALVHLHAGRHDDAAAYFERALDVRERVYGPDRTRVADNLLGTAEIAAERGRRAEAAELQ